MNAPTLPAHIAALGNVVVPDGRNGPWRIDTHVLTDNMIGLSNLCHIRDGNPEMRVNPGTYRRLIHEKDGLVMSNTQMEVRTNIEFIRQAKGDVLVLGLGLGMVLVALLKKPEVTSVTVIEISQDLIDLVGPHFNDPRLTIVCADALEWKPPKGKRYGAVWCDIWCDISDTNLDDMKLLSRRYSKRVSDWTGCWSREIVERMVRREKRSSRVWW